MKRFLLASVILSFAATGLGAAERHALLIGIGAYKQVKALDGPANDISALQSLLVHKYKYNPAYIRTLVDEQATKKAILEAMQQLVQDVKPGDYVLFVYSGHGTSFYDPHNSKKQAIGDGDDTGASLPVDFDYSSVEAFGRSVLLGREMRPYFTQLDAKAQVFAIYDSCFSQDAMKALSRGTTKYVPLSQMLQGASKGELDDVEQQATTKTADDSNAPLPYKHLIAISAAKRDQAALDIGAAELKRNPNATLDGKPHGQLTNAILIGLGGAADKNHDGYVSHEELFNYINEVSAGKWRHNPKLRVSADSTAALRQAALDGKAITLDNSCNATKTQQPRVSAPDDLFRELGPGFVPVTDSWDLKAMPAESGYLLYDAGGVQLNEKPMARDLALARLRDEPVLEQLSDLRYCRQSFNMALTSEPADLGKYMKGQKIQFYAKVDKNAFVLVIDIDQEGGVTILYPMTEANRLGAGQKAPLTKNLTVLPPFGVDLIKAFAFETKPPGFDRFVAPMEKLIYLHPGDPAMKDLLQMLIKDGPDRSETRLQLTTSSN